jgi:hypothetical protein
MERTNAAGAALAGNCLVCSAGHRRCSSGRLCAVCDAHCHARVPANGNALALCLADEDSNGGCRPVADSRRSDSNARPRIGDACDYSIHGYTHTHASTADGCPAHSDAGPSRADAHAHAYPDCYIHAHSGPVAKSGLLCVKGQTEPVRRTGDIV